MRAYSSPASTERLGNASLPSCLLAAASNSWPHRHTGAESSTAPPIVHEMLRSPGQPLDANTRASMESRFGHDFGSVRVHDDAQAVESAQAVDAQAYTVGRDIVFASGKYAPRTAKGRRLLAHELTHVVQQSPDVPMARASTAPLRVTGDRSSAPEMEADRVATTVARGEPRTASIQHQEYSIQRQEATEEEKRRWMGTGNQPMYRLHLDPEIEAQAMAFRLRGLLDPEAIQLSLSSMDLDSIVGYQPPPWVTAPPVPEPRPLVPRDAGPEKPRPGTAGDALKAIMRVPAVDTALTRLRTEATDRLSGDWRSLSTGGKAAVITQSAVIGGGAVAGILSDPTARRFALGLLENRSLPTGVPGLNFQFRLTGPEQRVTFDLNVGALLPSSWGFK